MSPQSLATTAPGLRCRRSTRDAPLACCVVSDVSRGEELSDVLAQRANSNPDKIKIRDLHGGTSRMYGARKQEGFMLTKVTVGLLTGLLATVGVARLLSTPGISGADSWPTRLVTMIVPFAA